MSSDGICVIDHNFSSHFEVGIILDRISGSHDPEVLVDQVSILSSGEGNRPRFVLLVPPD